MSWTEPSVCGGSGTVTLTSDYSSGSTFDVGETVVTYTAVDGSGSMDTASFTVTVQGRYILSI